MFLSFSSLFFWGSLTIVLGSLTIIILRSLTSGAIRRCKFNEIIS